MLVLLLVCWRWLLFPLSLAMDDDEFNHGGRGGGCGGPGWQHLFSLDGFGYVPLQPGDDDASLSAMHTCMRGVSFTFMTKDSSAILHPVAYDCHRTWGNEQRLHSHLGKCFSGDWLINKCCHMCFSQQFTWVTDCHAIKYILLYKGKNPTLLCLQMFFMCWDMDIKHHSNMYLTDANYFSWLGSDLCYNPLLQEYIDHFWAICCAHPPPTSLPIEP